MTKDFDASDLQFPINSIEQLIRIKQLEEENAILRKKLENPTHITEGPGGILYGICNYELQRPFLRKLGSTVYDYIQSQFQDDEDIAYLLENFFSDSHELEDLLDSFSYYARHSPGLALLDESERHKIETFLEEEIKQLYLTSASEIFDISDYANDVLDESIDEHGYYLAEEMLRSNPNMKDNVLEGLRLYSKMKQLENRDT